MNEEEMKKSNLKVMATADVAYLATVDSEGFPQVRAMANLRNAEQYPSAAKIFDGHDDDFLMYFTTHKSSDKMKHIQTNPHASVYFCDSKQRYGLLLAGKIEITSDTKLKKDLWQQRWMKHFPAGAEDPEYTVLRFVPSFAKGWCLQGPFKFRLAKK